MIRLRADFEAGDAGKRGAKDGPWANCGIADWDGKKYGVQVWGRRGSHVKSETIWHPDEMACSPVDIPV